MNGMQFPYLIRASGFTDPLYLHLDHRRGMAWVRGWPRATGFSSRLLAAEYVDKLERATEIVDLRDLLASSPGKGAVEKSERENER